MVNALISKNGKVHFVKEDKDIHTDFGVVKSSELSKKTPCVVKSHDGNEFVLSKPSLFDLFEKMRRGPQIVTLKDAAYIAARTGINSESIVVDAGGGSGALSIFFSLHAKRVYSYELRGEFVKIIKSNVELFSRDNVEIKEKDVFTGIEEKDIDILSLDLKEPWLVDASCVKLGGYLSVYVPTMNQVEKLNFRGFILEEVTELIKRDWKTDGILRPKSRMMAHTGFLCFFRRIR